MMKHLSVLVVLLLACVMVITGCQSATSTSVPAVTTATSQSPTSTSAATSAPVTSTTVKPTSLSPTSTSTSTSPVTPASEKPVYGGTIKYLYAYSPGSNIGWPPDQTNSQSIWGVNFVYAEPLVLYKHDNTVDPWLATSWSFASDFTSVTFTLREGVKFHNGHTFTADAVKFQMDKLIEAKAGAVSNIKSVDMLDDYHVRLNFAGPYTNDFWGSITATNCFFVDPIPYREKGEEWVRDHPVGTGPFKFVSWSRDQNMVFEKNTDYWQPGKPYLDKVEFITVKEALTAQAAMKNGDGNILSLQDGQSMVEMKKLGYRVVADPREGGCDMLFPDTVNADSKFADIRVREALEYAIDKEAMAEGLGYGYMLPWAQMPNAVSIAYDPTITGRQYNPDKARQLLAEAGFPNGFKTTLTTYETSGRPLAVQGYLKAVGIDAELQVVDNLQFWQMQMNGWKDILVCSYAFGPNFAATYKAYFQPYSVITISCKAPDGMKEVVDSALLATDPALQKKLNIKANRMIYDNAMAIVYMTESLGWVFDTKIKGDNFHYGADWQYWDPASTWIAK